MIDRIRASIRHRPWTVDIVSGAVSIAYGSEMAFDRNMSDASAYDFLNQMNDGIVGIAILTLGAFQLIFALLNIPRARRVMAFLSLWHWLAFTLGVSESDPHARVWTMYAGSALANLLILIRV